MSKTDSKGETRINISIPATGYKRRMLFNRYVLQKIDAHVLVHFGLVDESGLLRDSYSCVFSSQTLNDAKDSLTTFLARVGAPTTSNIKWVPPSVPTQTDLGNVINVGISHEAEILISAFAIGPAVAKTKVSDKPIELDGVAMLRCEPELLKLLIVELYGS